VICFYAEHEKQDLVKIQMNEPQKKFLAALGGKTHRTPPFWLMRQAGRYLPEYRELRAKAGGFLDLVYNPDFATEVTMQPLRRYGMDAAILFADILIVPHGLHRSLTFAEGEGPQLEPLRAGDKLPFFSPAAFDERAAPVYESVRQIRAQLMHEGFTDTALIGFAGAPWTVATYMVEGGSSRDFVNVKRWAYSDPESFSQLIDLITQATIYYLLMQVRAGAEALQLFDSWAGVLDEQMFRRWVIGPTREIVDTLRSECPDVPVIGFPRGAGRLYQEYVQNTGVTALGLDPQVPAKWAASVLQPTVSVQGNLDPICLLAGGDALLMATENILMNLSGGPFVFNLGHGVHKDTPPEHVAQLAKLLKDWK